VCTLTLPLVLPLRLGSDFASARHPQGLGKTLQAIALLWTLLRQGIDGQPTAKRVIIVCPTSLVSNWCAQIRCAHLLRSGLQLA
jgi:hypothetical protein